MGGTKQSRMVRPTANWCIFFSLIISLLDPLVVTGAQLQTTSELQPATLTDRPLSTLLDMSRYCPGLDAANKKISELQSELAYTEQCRASLLGTDEFGMADSNKDGQISRAEFVQAFGDDSKAEFDSDDLDGNGELSKKEYAKAFGSDRHLAAANLELKAELAAANQRVSQSQHKIRQLEADLQRQVNA